jgi:hypothetical protein
MKLEDGKTYVNGEGRHVKVMGRTRDHEHLVWSRCGDWYERETGRRILFHDSGGNPRTHHSPTWRDLVAEAPPEDEGEVNGQKA